MKPTAGNLSTLVAPAGVGCLRNFDIRIIIYPGCGSNVCTKSEEHDMSDGKSNIHGYERERRLSLLFEQGER